MDRWQEASWAPEDVAGVEKRNNNQQEIPKTDDYWPGNGSGGRYVSDFELGSRIDH